MLSLFSLLAVAAAVSAQVVPKTPATANVGSQITIEWDADTTGTWTNTSIDFMSGDNWNMIDIENVATGIDGTTTTSLQWTVPDVNIYSNIYFFQFTKDGDVSTATWCTRFTIASAAGKTVAAPDSIQPDGQTIGWGSGGLAGATAASTVRQSSGPSAASGSAAVSSESQEAASSASVAESSSSSVSSTSSSSSSSSAAASESAAEQANASASPSVTVDNTSDATKQVAGLGLVLVLGLTALIL